MLHRLSVVFLVLSLAFVGAAACTSASGGHGGDDDDDLTIDTGDGDADADADADADGDANGTCAGACGTIANICTGADENGCLDACNRYDQFSAGQCSDAFAAYNACVEGAQTCDPQNGPAGCDAQARAADTACANGCIDVVNCLNACADGDEVCQQGCVENGDPTGLRMLQNLLNCWTEACGEPPAADADQAAQDAFSQCLDDNCDDEYVQCR